jgi:DNA-binding MarR family transcriptional regulator
VGFTVFATAISERPADTVIGWEMKHRTPSGTEVDLGPLGRDLPFMIRNIQVLLRPEGEAIRNALGIEHGSIGVLSIVWLNPGISQNDLAASLAMKKSAIAKLVKLLEEQKLVSRKRISADRRFNALTLTSEGHLLVAEIRRLTDALNARLLEGTEEADRGAFFRVLARLFARLDQATSLLL